MNDFADSLFQYWPVSLAAIFLVVILFGFIFKFVVPANKLGRDLSKALAALTAIKGKTTGIVVDLDEIAREAMSHPRLSHLWAKYAETLHAQRRQDETGNIRIDRWRATSLAETFFTEQAIVSTPLKTEFYKHLPGILTGIGIIGTFSGLILGLMHFDVSLEPQKAQAQLANLVKAVGHAFYVSAGAITLAMLFTWIEKSLVTARHRQVEKLHQIIDSLFDAGAGEEYLERMVVASETQATQAIHIKEALVADLREILTELTSRQMEAYDRHSGRMSADIGDALSKQSGQISTEVGKAIAEQLGGPMQDIASAVKSVSANQGDAVNKMLTDVLASFSSQMQEMFGGQMTGMNDLLRQTSEAMQNTASQFAQLASNMDTAGKGAVEAMGERLNHAISSMEARQQIMNRQMGEFVEQIRSVVSESQSEAGRKMQETLAAMGEQVASVVSELRRQGEEASETQGRRQERFEKSTGNAIGTLSAQMEALLGQSVETNRALQETVAQLSAATNKAIADMNSGAETLFVAASDFAKAGQGVTDTMKASGAAMDSIRESSQTLSSASAATREVLADHGKTRDSFAFMVSELKSTVENAKREAAMTKELVDTLGAATEKLSTAQRQSEEYLKGVSEVLIKAHESFAENVERTLREGNRQFQNELGTAVGLLSGAIKDLGDTLDDLPTRK